MVSELGENKNLPVEQAEWVLGERIPCRYCCLCDYFLSDFKQRISEKLEHLGDAAINAQQLDMAISNYSAALSLDPVAPRGLLIRRSKAYTARGLWKDALDDANKVRSFVSCGSFLSMAPSLGDHARSILSMGLREEARSLTEGRTL